MDWPLDDSGKCLNFLNFNDCENLTIKGEGMIDGLGYDWWVREWKGKNTYGRPHLLNYQRVQTSEITGVEFRNSPQWNMALVDIDSLWVHDMEIMVDILRQRSSYSRGHAEALSFEE